MKSTSCQQVLRSFGISFVLLLIGLGSQSAAVAQEPDPWRMVDRSREQSVRKLVQRISAFWELYGSTANRTATREVGTWVIRQHDISREIQVDSLWFSNEGNVLNFRFDQEEIGYCAIRKRNMYVFLEPYTAALPDPVAPTTPELESQIAAESQAEVETEAVEEEVEVSEVEPEAEEAEEEVEISEVEPETEEIEEEVEVSEVEPETEEIEEEIEVTEVEPETEEIEEEVEISEVEPEAEEAVEEEVEVSEVESETEEIEVDAEVETGPEVKEEDSSVKLMIDEYESQLFALQNQLQQEQSVKDALQTKVSSLEKELQETQHKLATVQRAQLRSAPLRIKPGDTGVLVPRSTTNDGPSLQLNNSPAVPLQPGVTLIQVSDQKAIPWEMVRVQGKHQDAQYKLLYIPVGGKICTFIKVTDPDAFWSRGNSLIVVTEGL